MSTQTPIGLDGSIKLAIVCIGDGMKLTSICGGLFLPDCKVEAVFHDALHKILLISSVDPKVYGTFSVLRGYKLTPTILLNYLIAGEPGGFLYKIGVKLLPEIIHLLYHPD